MGPRRSIRVVHPAGLVSMLLVWVLALVGAAVPASAGTGEVTPANHMVIGGCHLRFTSTGQPALAPSRTRPCVGASSVELSPLGDVRVHLAGRADDPQTRLLTSVDATLAARGITVGATRASGWVELRYFDATRDRRLDLRRAGDRARLASAGTTVGWVGVAPDDVSTRDLGLDVYGPFHDALATEATTVPGGCVIRFASTGPWIHANSTHHCTGLRSVGITSTGQLRLVASDEQRGSVVNVAADPDETLTARGIVAGVSTGVGEMHVRFYDTRLGRTLDLTRQADRDRVAGSTSNLWLSWTKTTRRPGAVNASYTPAISKYGPYINGSALEGSLHQTGCEVRFSELNGQPFLAGSDVSWCTGVQSVTVDAKGRVLVTASPTASGPIVGTSTVSSRAATDYGVRAGVSGGGTASTYTLYSIKLARFLDLRVAGDRVILQRSGSSLYLGWTRPRG